MTQEVWLYLLCPSLLCREGLFLTVLIKGCRVEEEAVIKDVDLEAPCTLHRPGRPRLLGNHEGA